MSKEDKQSGTGNQKSTIVNHHSQFELNGYTSFKSFKILSEVCFCGV